MDLTTFLIIVYCLVDDFLKGKRLRQRGLQPTLSDSEVVTMEIVGEFLGIDTDSGIFRYFRRHYGDWFPVLRQVHRTTNVHDLEGAEDLFAGVRCLFIMPNGPDFGAIRAKLK